MPAGEALLAYFDTSVLVKCYVTERGSDDAVAALRRHAVMSSAIAPIEIASALRRRRDAGEITAADLRTVQSRLQRERAAWVLRLPDAPLLDRAERVAERLVVRALDAVHLASALLFCEEAALRTPFVTADGRQRQAATALGLDVLFIQ